MKTLLLVSFCIWAELDNGQPETPEARPRARDIGLVVGVFEPGLLNAITDVKGVRVGHTTKIVGDDIRTGVTAIIPAPGNLYTHPVPAWIHVGIGYGKMI
ncbi:MAG: P1 family peptidase, partial [Pseudomonadales bacterium]|nr:P1 family peptidase [Pseudomonadales bacterium]